MKVITYLGFTVLSIVVQFCVMDFIQEKIQLSKNANLTNQKKVVDDLLKNISSKPHALFYRTHMSTRRSVKRSPALTSFPGLSYNNLTEPAGPLGTTDISTTIFDIFYEENTSTTEPTTTTETFITTTDYDNITEITYFETTNKSTTIPNIVPNASFSKYCGCNLLYKVCDINCCCDLDCTADEQKHFRCEKTIGNRLNSDGCITHLLDGHSSYGNSMLNNVFCVVKINLPDKCNIKQPNLAFNGPYNKWKSITQDKTMFAFQKTLYKQADPIWLLKNGTIYYLDFPTPIINSYCTDRAPITFLKDENIKCIVKLKDLEMFHVSQTVEESMVISATENTINSSALNCSSLHCVNWTVLACNNGSCKNYNKSLNEAACTESVCTNVALKMDYYFYYNHFKITNAAIKLHIQNVSNVLPFLTQEITVKFIMANKSLDSIVEFSGNPGYINNLPIIVSKAKSNFTESFFNNTSDINHAYFPGNDDGMCVISKSSQNVVRFGVNKRTKCRYVHTDQIVTHNSTAICKSIQNNISNFIDLNTEVYISPFGNPYGITDENWIRLRTENTDNGQKPVYGEYRESVSKLHCYNLINRVSVLLIFANVNEKDFTDQNKILLAKYETVTYNASFDMEDISTVLTIDISFVDATKPNLYVYAGSPHFNIHLPKDFFFPFPSNNCLQMSNSCIVTIFCCVIIFFFANKITLE